VCKNYCTGELLYWEVTVLESYCAQNLAAVLNIGDSVDGDTIVGFNILVISKNDPLLVEQGRTGGRCGIMVDFCVGRYNEFEFKFIG
jgi:hypothetical protein